MEEVQANIAIYIHALLRIHIIGGQRLAKTAPSCLPSHQSGPATRDFQSSILVEVVLHGYHLDVQGLFQPPPDPLDIDHRTGPWQSCW